MKTASSIAAMVLAASTLLACGGQGQTAGGAAQPAAAKKQGEVIATVGGDAITVDDFQAKMEEQSPFIRARYTTLERKKEFLDNMVRFEVLAQEAERRGFANDPDVVATMKKVMVQKLMRAEFDENAAAQEIPEAELKAFYDANVNDYVKPERVRVSHIFLAAAKGDATRAKAKSEAARLLADVKGKEAGPIKTAFAETAKTRSEDTASKAAGGDLLFKTKEELAQAWGESFADAVFGMKTIGEVGGIVETDKGIHLVKLTGRQNALDRPFESVKSQIQNRLFREKRTKSFEDFVAQLKEKANVQVKDDVLASVEVVPAAEQALGAGMQPPAAPAAPMPVPVKADTKAEPKTLKGPNGRTVTLPAGALQAPKPQLLNPPNKAEK
ncbi:peptidyl-prolyl cis-trans isomerase [Vulgatibacter sp.]|uniref:peptidylprolyl isomerase n=1 Tax=Vulgatibacter sp. TaxID=1971226 RepID=UPI003568E97C